MPIHEAVHDKLGPASEETEIMSTGYKSHWSTQLTEMWEEVGARASICP